MTSGGVNSATGAPVSAIRPRPRSDFRLGVYRCSDASRFRFLIVLASRRHRRGAAACGIGRRHRPAAAAGAAAAAAMPAPCRSSPPKSSRRDVPVDLAAIGNVEAYTVISVRSQVTGVLEQTAVPRRRLRQEGPAALQRRSAAVRGGAGSRPRRIWFATRRCSPGRGAARRATGRKPNTRSSAPSASSSWPTRGIISKDVAEQARAAARRERRARQGRPRVGRKRQGAARRPAGDGRHGAGLSSTTPSSTRPSTDAPATSASRSAIWSRRTRPS